LVNWKKQWGPLQSLETWKNPCLNRTGQVCLSGTLTVTLLSMKMLINNFQQSLPFQIINLTSSKETKNTKVHALVNKCISMLVKPLTLFIFYINFSSLLFELCFSIQKHEHNKLIALTLSWNYCLCIYFKFTVRFSI